MVPSIECSATQKVLAMQRKHSVHLNSEFFRLILRKIRNMSMHGAQCLLFCASMHIFYAGRALYALTELVDITCYATAYCGVLMVIINRLRSALTTQGADVPSSLALFPAVLLTTWKTPCRWLASV